MAASSVTQNLVIDSMNCLFTMSNDVIDNKNILSDFDDYLRTLLLHRF